MNKIVDLILGILIFVSAIGYGIVEFKFPEHRNNALIICAVIVLICIRVMVAQNGNNPKSIKEKKNEKQRKSVLFMWGKRIVFLLILIPIIYLYFLLNILECGIFLLTIAFAYFFFPDGIPFELSDFCPYLKITTFNFRHLIAILLISTLGYFLNGWTYTQSGEIQLAITIGLPILYGIIYYKLHHKKQVREI